MKVRELKELMIKAKEEHENNLKNCQSEIQSDPSKAYYISIKMAGILNQISNVENVISVCETIDEEKSIFGEKKHEQ